ncbi:MAG TPA: hypothetical protein VM286_05840 [Candidatus Thermoplasmatota archaeon]|nr:hypothetical protein [Candidatus Thermoplasmatota archaeon]
MKPAVYTPIKFSKETGAPVTLLLGVDSEGNAIANQPARLRAFLENQLTAGPNRVAEDYLAGRVRVLPGYVSQADYYAEAAGGPPNIGIQVPSRRVLSPAQKVAGAGFVAGALGLLVAALRRR